MKRLPFFLRLLALLSGVARLAATDYVFNNSPAGDIVFAGSGADRRSSVYPSIATAAAIPSGTVTAVKVTLAGLTVLRPDDMEMVLVSPTGDKLVFWADNGSGATSITGFTITLDDAAGTLLPDGAGLVNGGSFRPSCVDAQTNITTEFPGVTVASPGDCATPRGFATFTSQFGGNFTAGSGTGKDPNGQWKLYSVDDVSGVDNINSTTSRFTGWTLTISADVTTVGTTTTLSSSQASSTTANSVTFTATVKKQTDSSAVSSGTVTFSEGATTLAANVALNGSGQAAFSTAALTEGDHTITAVYNAGTGFLTSNSSLLQRVDNATASAGNTFSNSGSISVPGTGNTAVVYPSRIFVSGVSGAISKVTVQIKGLSVDRPDDVELLLVSPGGQNMVILGDAGGVASPINNVDLVFDDSAASSVPDATPPATGTYKPTSYDSADDSGSYPAVATPLTPPLGPYPHAAPQGSATLASVFNGINPNGAWSLYLQDDVTGSGITIANGWSLTFTTTSDASTATTVTSVPNPSLVGEAVTFTATVTTSPGGVAVTAGTVTFREGAAVLAGPIALDGSGIASFPTSSLTEGDHLIFADYSGQPGSFNTSTSAGYDQRVDGSTTVTGPQYCNPSQITVLATAPYTSSVYPSHINVAGLTGPILKLTVQLNGITIDRPDDLELLLVGPNGNNLVLLSDAGGTALAASGVNLTFDDGAASLIPDAGPLTSGTFRPTSINSTPSTFPPPAPALASQVHAAPAGVGTLAGQFNGISANGTWSLYGLDDVPGGGATVSGGWCLTFTVDSPPVAGPDTILRDQDRSVKVPIADLLSNDSDPNGTTPTFVSVAATSANGAAVHVVGSWINYEAIPGINSDDTFAYTITDGTSNSNGTVLVKVQRPNGQTFNLTATTAPGTVTLRLAGIPGRSYQFQYTADLTPPVAWTDLGSPQSADAAGGATEVDSSGLTRFYRAIEP